MSIRESQITAAWAEERKLRRANLAEIDALLAALKQVKLILTIPAAEYVPAIPDAWEVIDKAIAPYLPQKGRPA